MVITIPMSLLGVIYAPEVIRVIAPGFASDSEKLELCVLLTRIMMPYIACVSVIAMINSALNALAIFGASAWAQVVMNLVLIAGALAALPFDPRTTTTILAVSVLIGGAIQILAQLPAVRRGGLSLRPSLELGHRDIREVLRLMIPATIGASVYQITIFLATLLASLLAEGSVSWLFYADRIAQFPLGIFSIALASVLLPALANASAADDHDTFRGGLSNSLRYTSFIILPMASGIWALALPLTELLFERGAFSHHSSLMTAQALQALAFGLWATSCHSMVVRAFIARKDTITPTLIGVGSLVINVATALLLMGPIEPHGDLLSESVAHTQSALYSLIPWRSSLGHVGLAAASSVAAFCSLVVVLALFTVRIGNFPWRDFLTSTARSALASLVMACTVSWIAARGFSAATAVLAGLAVAVPVYILVCAVLLSPELRETAQVILRLSKRASRHA
jgi:putative peptidoglycan lipid II flippase